MLSDGCFMWINPVEHACSWQEGFERVGFDDFNVKIVWGNKVIMT